MRCLNELGMPAFLDSANHGGRNGSLDVLAAAPSAFMLVENGVFSCTDNVTGIVGRSTSSVDFFSNIRFLKDKLLPTTENESASNLQMEHAGSLIAYLGYPALNGKAKLRISDAFVGVYLWTVVVDHALECCELRAHPSCSSDYIDGTAASIIDSLTAAAAGEPPSFSLESPFCADTSYTQYQSAFDEIKTRIDDGDCYQVNLTQRFTASGRGDPLGAYLKLRRATKAPFSAYLDWGSGALLSLSPERFISLQQDAVLTQPIKGTRPRGESNEQDCALVKELASSEKDRAENLMIVDLMRNDLGRVCITGSIEVNQLFAIESFSNVHHMVSAVSGRLHADRDALDLLASCYPGGSITGAPKLSAMHIIQEVERDTRRIYCGTVFRLGANWALDSSITIRSLLWQSGKLHCWAGGGIVADSDCAQEYQECFDKIDNIFNALHDLG